MRKIFIGILTVLCSPAAFAQYDKTFEFADKDMNVIPDGTVINLSDVEEYPYLGFLIDTGLFVKDNSDGEPIGASCEVEITQITNGSVKLCFPMLCKNYWEAGTYETEIGLPSNWNPTHSLAAEWLAEGEGIYGTCTVTYRLKAYDAYEGMTPEKYEYELRGNGPSVTVNYIYSDPTGISGATAEKEISSISYFDLSGRKVSAPVKGVYVKKTAYADGRVATEKTLVK